MGEQEHVVHHGEIRNRKQGRERKGKREKGNEYGLRTKRAFLPCVETV